jgi:hypothetical protein
MCHEVAGKILEKPVFSYMSDFEKYVMNHTECLKYTLSSCV